MLLGCYWVVAAMLLECYLDSIGLACEIDGMWMLLGFYRVVTGMLMRCY